MHEENQPHELHLQNRNTGSRLGKDDRLCQSTDGGDEAAEAKNGEKQRQS